MTTVYDVDGKALGTVERSRRIVKKESGVGYRVEHRDLLREERAIVVAFLRSLYGKKHVQKENQTLANTDNQGQKKNQVMLAGTIKKWKVEADRVFGLLDVGMEKWVPITAHEKEEEMKPGLMESLAKFEEGDTLVMKGHVRPWSRQLENRQWQNGMDIRITEVKPDCIPNRAPKETPKKKPQDDYQW